MSFLYGDPLGTKAWGFLMRFGPGIDPDFLSRDRPDPDISGGPPF